MSVGKRTKKDIFFDTLIAIFMVIFVVVTLYPIVNTLAVSFNDGLDTIRGGIYLLPRVFTLKNYQSVLSQDSLKQAAIVSVARTAIGTVVSTFCASLLAFIVSRKEYMFKKQLTIMYIITMYVSGGLIPGYILFKYLHLFDNFLVYIIPVAVGAFNMIIIRTFINGLPDSLAESAKIDGAGDFRIFLQIILPLCTPVLATVALFEAVGQWNAWFDAMLYNSSSPNLTVLQYELMKLLSSTTNVASANTSQETLKHQTAMATPASIRAAATIVTMLPIICLYPFLQKYFVTGLTIGGVKE